MVLICRNRLIPEGDCIGRGLINDSRSAVSPDLTFRFAFRARNSPAPPIWKPETGQNSIYLLCLWSFHIHKDFRFRNRPKGLPRLKGSGPDWFHRNISFSSRDLRINSSSKAPIGTVSIPLKPTKKRECLCEEKQSIKQTTQGSDRASVSRRCVLSRWQFLSISFPFRASNFSHDSRRRPVLGAMVVAGAVSNREEQREEMHELEAQNAQMKQQQAYGRSRLFSPRKLLWVWANLLSYDDTNDCSCWSRCRRWSVPRCC